MRALSLALGFGALLASLPACTEIPDHRTFGPSTSADGGGLDGSTGGSSDGGSSNGGSGGSSGGGAGGAAGGAGGGVSSGGSGGAVTGCPGGPTCETVTVSGVGTLPGCTGSTGACGLDLTSLGAQQLCLELHQPGEDSASCPASTALGNSVPGCCRMGSSTCGVHVTIGSADFGCVDPTILGQPAGGSCALSCGATGSTCINNSDCCPGRGGDPSCVTFDSSNYQCTSFCTHDRDCQSGCCILLTSGRGACSLDGSQSSCTGACGSEDAVCDCDDDCCSGFSCVGNREDGPRLCRPKCTGNADCGVRQQCITDAATGAQACSRTGAVLCSDTCQFTGLGGCNDGGTGSDSSLCTFGTDCTHCGHRFGGNEKCDDSCGSVNGTCEDGGTGAKSYSCNWGSDCTDCGPRSSICVDTCASAHDGTCDYDTGLCALGTDCDDCGFFYGGRGEGVCDGTQGTFCTGPGGSSTTGSILVGDGNCMCQDCAWEAPDCGSSQTTLCDGQSISSCCDPNNSCDIGSDGFCDCGGWCSWESADCSPSSSVTPSGPLCDGSSDSCCAYPMPAGCESYLDGFCDCQGACSWEAADCSSLGTTCEDTCPGNPDYVGDSFCDDGGSNSFDGLCPLGTDCADCGPR